MSNKIMNTQSSKKTFTEEITGTISEIKKQVKKLIREGNARRVLIKDKNGKTLFQSQLTIGVGGVAILTAIAPIVSAISMFALFMNDIKIIVERYPDEEMGKDEYEVDADVIEIREEEEEGEKKEEKTDKTVGKKDEEE
ncbi:MAG: DUF4342 domain-containing protein [Balneolaceae bacterium]|jgi:hypothetical protein